MDYLDPTRPMWGYAEAQDSETWQGCSTQEEAEAGAAELEGGGYVQRGFYPDPAKVAADLFDLDDVLERMEELAADNELFAGDDQIFTYEAGAEDALKAALAEWARKYLKATIWTATNDEPVRVEPAE